MVAAVNRIAPTRGAFSRSDVRRAGRRVGLALSAGEEELYAEALNALTCDLRELETYAPATEIDYGNLPQRGEPDEVTDGDNAFITRCSIRTTGVGSLAGKTIGLKDNISVAGVPMTIGSRFLGDFVPPENADLVDDLLRAGATIVGKLNMDGFSHAAHGFGTGLGDYGRCRNPRTPNAVSGGSSSGCAAAVASGAVDIAIGTDQGGSIRIPAAWCGIVGLKPGRDAVSTARVVGVDEMLDTVGPMAASVADVEAAFSAIARDSAEAVRLDGEPPSILALHEGFAVSEPAVSEAVRSVLRTLRKGGASVVEESIPTHAAAEHPFRTLVFAGQASMMMTWGGAHRRDAVDVDLVRAFIRRRTKRDSLPPRVKLAMLFGSVLQDDLWPWYVLARRACRVYERVYDDALQHHDVIAMPTAPCVAPEYSPPRDAEEALRRTVIRSDLRNVTRNTSPFNLSGHPAVTIPCGETYGGSVGLMLVGRRGGEHELLRIAGTLESACGR